MEPVKPKLNWKTLVFPLLGLLGFFLYIYLFQVDILGIIATAQTANPSSTVAIACGIIEVLFYTISGTLTNHLDQNDHNSSLPLRLADYTLTHCSGGIADGEVTGTYLFKGPMVQRRTAPHFHPQL
jgi:hypothetical protein